MSGPIVNRVSKSPIITFDLEELYQDGSRKTLDIAQWLDHGFILREKSFRESVKNFDFTSYKNTYTALHCSTDAIVPSWAFMLVAAHLQTICKKIVYGTLETLENVLFTEKLATLDFTYLKDAPVIIKGCTNKPVPNNAYVLAFTKIQPFAKSIMYGEACSAVPLYKKPKN